MIYSHRVTDSKPLRTKKSTVSQFSATTKFSSMPSSENTSDLVSLLETIRKHELTNLESRNNILKKQIEIKQKTEKLKLLQKQLQLLKKQKQSFEKLKQKFDLQRKNKDQRIFELESDNEELKSRVDNFEVPKDRYETCMRELDQIKNNIQNKQNVVKERDLYKYFYQEVKELVLCEQFSDSDVRKSLKSFFNQMKEKLSSNTK